MTSHRPFDAAGEHVDDLDLIDMVYPVIHDHDLPHRVKADLIEGIDLVRKYPHGSAELRRALSIYLGVDQSRILITAGINGGLDILAQAVLVGRKVVIPTPAFWQLAEAPLRYGAEVITCDLFDQDGVLKAFEQADAVILAHPNNPLGTPLPREFLHKLCAVAGERPVIVDESYSDMAGDSFVSGPHFRNLIVLKGFKTFLMPGVRAGYIVANEDIIEQLAWRMPPFAVTVQAEVGAMSVLRHLDDIKEIWRRVAIGRTALERSLNDLGGECTTSTTPFVCWRYSNATKIGRALLSEGVATMFPGKGTIIDMPPDCIRMTVRKPEVQAIVIEKLKIVLSKLGGAI